MGNKNIVKIQFWKTISNSYGIFFRNIGEFFHLIWFLAIATYGINFALAFWFPSNQFPYVSYFGLIFQTVCFSVFAVSWHRLVILNERQKGRWFFIKFTKREFLFSLVSILFAIFFYGTLFVVGFILNRFMGEMHPSTLVLIVISNIIVAVFIGIYFARLGLIYPRISIDLSLSLRECWRIGKGNILRLYFGYILAIIPLTIVGSILTRVVKSWSAYNYYQGTENLVSIIIVEFITLICLFGAVGVGAGFISLSYKHLDPLPMYDNPEKLE